MASPCAAAGEMAMSDEAGAAPAPQELHLLGAPSLADYIERVRERSVGGRDADEGELIARWGAAAKRYHELETTEAGLAESAELRALAPPLAALCREVIADRYFRRAFAALPVGFGWVELDKLVVFQQHVSLDHAERLAASLGDAPTEEALFRFCLPVDHPPPEVHVAQNGPKTFVFSSPLSDVRAYGPRLLEAETLSQVASDGALAAGIGLLVGYGSAHLNVVRHANRIVLNNGYHRAYALRALGLTHAPCIVQAVENSDELAYAGDSALVEHYPILFRDARPALLKDFFDPALTTRHPMLPTRKQIQVRVEVEVLRVPA